MAWDIYMALVGIVDNVERRTRSASRSSSNRRKENIYIYIQIDKYQIQNLWMDCRLLLVLIDVGDWIESRMDSGDVGSGI